MDDTYKLNLQLFAEGGEGAAPAGDAGTSDTGATPEVAAPTREKKPTGMYAGRLQMEMTAPAPAPAKRVPAADSTKAKPAQQPATPPAEDAKPAPERKPFADVLKEYKDESQKWVDDLIGKRFKNQADAAAKLEQYTPIIEALADRYGLQDPSDVQAIQKALEGDDSWLEEQAMREGVPTDALRKQKAAERDAAKWQSYQAAQQQEQQMRAQFDRITQDATAFAESNGIQNFNLASEMQNETFGKMVANGFSVAQAYHAAHYQEIEAQRQAATVQKVGQAASDAKKAAANAIASGSHRPTENGSSGAAASLQKIDISKLTQADIRDIMARATRGEPFPSSLFAP